MASSAYYINGKDEVTAGPSRVGIESEQSPPCPPMTEDSTTRGLSATPDGHFKCPLNGVQDENTNGTAGVYSISEGMKKMKLKDTVGHDIEGWSKLAAMQNNQPNLCFFRGFGYGSKRILSHLQGRIVHLLGQLRELELDESPKIDLKSPSAGQKRNVENEYTPDCRDRIMDEITGVLDKYYRFLLYDNKVQALHGPLMDEVTGLYGELKGQGLLDDEALAFAMEPDDFVCTRPAEAHTRRFMTLLYSPWGNWLRKLLRSDAPGRWTIQYNTILFLEGAALTLVSMVILLGPVGLLYLAPMTKTESYCVVVGFVTVFGSVIVLTKDPMTKFRDIMIVIFGYAAVLSAILVQTGYLG